MNLKFITCFLSIVPLFLFAQRIPDTVRLEIQRRIELSINPSISIGLLSPHGETQFYNFGSIGTETTQSADNLTLYEIGSVTKTFTATLAGKYLKDTLNTPVSSLFPNIHNPELEQVTLRELLNHISGTPRLSNQFTPKDWSNPFNGYSDSLLTVELQALKPDTSGTWSYSNFGYGILGKALEQVLNMSFEDLMSRLLKKAQMPHTLLNHASDTQQQMAQPTNIGMPNSYWNFTGPSRYAGGLISCTHDLINYLKYQQRTNPLFLSDSLDNLIPTGIPHFGPDRLFYKNGWFVLKPESGVNILLHNGGTGGFTSFVAYNKQTQTGVVALSNSVSLVDDIGLKLIYPSFKLNRPERTIAYVLADEIAKGKISSLVGTYDRLKSEEYPDNILDTYWLERYFFGKEKYTVSNQLSDIMVKVLPNDWEVMDIKGQNLEQLGQYKAAANAYQNALELSPENDQLKEKIKRCKAHIPRNE